MKSLACLTTSVACVSPILAFSSPCTSGDQSQHQLLKTCTIKQAHDSVSGATLSDIQVCVSQIEKSGGPFGGDTIPWFYSHFSFVDGSGKKVEYVFNSPNGRHNFRSLLDYSVVEMDETEFYMESHRTKYPEGSRSGMIDLHTVTYDLSSSKLTFDYTQRAGVLFGRWTNQVSFEGVCQ